MAQNWKLKGELSQAKVMAALLDAGKTILLPFGDNQRYDLVIDEDSKFTRVQVKTARLIKARSVISFNTCSNHPGPGRQSYHGQADLFGVYCPETKGVYIVPVSKCGITAASLRLTSPRKLGNQKTIRWAKDYELKEIQG